METKTINGIYEGYIWMSDQDSPKVFKGDTPVHETLSENANPFIVEAQLFNRSNNISISIKYIDGHYVVTETDLNVISNGDKIEELEFIPSFSGSSNLLFKRIWSPKEDMLCPGYFVLEPSREAFVGFKKD